MTFPRSLPRNFRYLEWIFITAFLGMWLSSLGNNLPTALGLCGVVFFLSWFFPCDRPHWQRLGYVILTLAIVVYGRSIGLDLGPFFFIYISKSYFLLNRRTTIAIACITAIPWVFSDYLAEADWFQHSSISRWQFDPNNTLKFAIFTLAAYIAASVFTIMFSSMVIAEYESRQRAEQLSEQVESLVATLERTRIAREIHDSLGHTLTALDIQLEVAQKLRFHNLEQAFEAVDTAKMLAGQCIEDASFALHRIRQSDFDLNQALTALMEQMRQNAVQVQWEVNLPQLSIHQSYQIYCIVKEGLVNVQKHARASQVSFCGRLTSEGIILDLKDNGIGFDPKTNKKL